MKSGRTMLTARSTDGLCAMSIEIRVPVGEMAFWHPKRIEQLFWGVAQVIEAAGGDWKPPETDSTLGEQS